MRAFRMMSYDVILSLHTVHLYSQCIEKDIPFRLLSHWEPTCHTADMTLFECDVRIWSELQRAPPDDRVTTSVKATNKQACPLPDRKLGAAEALPCLICRQHLLPPCRIIATLSDGVHRSMLDGCFDFSLYDTSVACHVVLCLSGIRARPWQMCFSFHSACLQIGLALTNRPAWQTCCRRSGGLTRKPQASAASHWSSGLAANLWSRMSALY